MVYVGRDGTIYQDQPWGIKKIMGIIYGIINMLFAFFQTLIPIESSSSTNNFRNSGGRSSGGYPRPPGPPRPGSNIHGLDSGPPEPPPACGSCCGR